MAEFTESSETEQIAPPIGAVRIAPPVGAVPVAPPIGAVPIAPPAGATRIQQEEELGLFTRTWERFWGTDVDDPLEMYRLSGMLAGGFAGGTLGSRLPRAPGLAGLVINPYTGAVITGLAGTIAGAISPETALEAAESLGVIKAGERERLGLSPEDLRTLAEGEALLELATGGSLSTLRMGGRLTARVVAGVKGEAREVAEAAARQGIELMPVQVGKRVIGRGYVTVMGRFPWIGSRFKKYGEGAEEAFRKRISDIPESFAPLSSWSDVSETIFTDAKNLTKTISDSFGTRYKDIFQRAEDFGVWVIPRQTLTKAEEILTKIGKETPAKLVGEGDPGPVLQKVRDFIADEILTMKQAIAEGTVTANQSLRQMDGVIAKIDQEIASLEPGQKRFAMSLLTQLRQAAQRDVLENVRGVNGDVIARELKELDTEFTHTMSDLFETATAKRFQSVQRRGLRGITADEATRIPVDQLSKTVVNLQSPQAIDELSRLVTPETFKRIVAQTFDDAYNAAQAGGRGFDAEAFGRYLGIDRPGSNRHKTFATMLEKAGGILAANDLDDLMVAAKVIGDLDIPNASTFLARKATIGSVKGLIHGLVPGLVLGAGAGAAGYGMTALLGIAVFSGGGKLMSAILANPASARALRQVLDKEATTLVKRQAALDTVRLGIAYLSSEGELPITVTRMQATARMMFNAFDEELRSFGINLPYGATTND